MKRLKASLLPSYIAPKYDRLTPGWYKITYKGDSQILEIGEPLRVSQYGDWTEYEVKNGINYTKKKYVVLKEELIEFLSKEDKLELL